jgi:hypothetical protein
MIQDARYGVFRVSEFRFRASGFMFDSYRFQVQGFGVGIQVLGSAVDSSRVSIHYAVLGYCLGLESMTWGTGFTVQRLRVRGSECRV